MKRKQNNQQKYTMQKMIINGEESDSDNEDNEDDKYIKTINNNIYFHCDVNKKNVLELLRQLTTLANSLKKIDTQYNTKSEINLYIHSDGGDLFAGLSAMHHVEQMDIHINTIVDGVAMSAATFILMGGHTRKMYPYSMVLIHQLKTGFWGTHECLIDELKNSNLIMQNLKDMYLSKSKIPAKKLDEILKRELLFGSKDCIKYKLVDKII